MEEETEQNKITNNQYNIGNVLPAYTFKKVYKHISSEWNL